MSAATVTDISTAAKKVKDKPDTIGISVILPEDLHSRIMIDSVLSKTPISSMVEDWIEQNSSPADVTVGLASMMKNTATREKMVPGVVMKGLSVQVSKRHYGMIRMEALRKNTTIRALLKEWILENVKEWSFEPVEQEEWENRIAA